MAPSQPLLRPNQIPVRVQHHRVSEPINIVRTSQSGHIYSQNRRVPQNFSNLANLQEIRLSDIRPSDDNTENNDNIELNVGQNSQTSIAEANLIANIQNSEGERTSFQTSETSEEFTFTYRVDPREDDALNNRPRNEVIELTGLQNHGNNSVVELTDTRSVIHISSQTERGEIAPNIFVEREPDYRNQVNRSNSNVRSTTIEHVDSLNRPNLSSRNRILTIGDLSHVTQADLGLDLDFEDVLLEDEISESNFDVEVTGVSMNDEREDDDESSWSSNDSNDEQRELENRSLLDFLEREFGQNRHLLNSDDNINEVNNQDRSNGDE